MRAWSLTPRLATLLCAGAVALLLARDQAPTSSGPAVPPGPPVLDVLVLDGAGHPVRTLALADFAVSIDGRPRRVVAASFVFRGPGAEQAAAFTAASARPAAGASAMPQPFPASPVGFAETARSIVIAVDENTIARGAEKPIAGLLNAVVDLLGASDRLALVALPELRGGVSFDTDREPVREQTARLAGRAATGDHLARPQDEHAALPTLSDDVVPERQQASGVSDSNKTPTEPTAAEVNRETPARGSFEALARTLAALQPVPGLKTVLLISGVTSPSERQAAQARAEIVRIVEAAGAARASVHVVKLGTTLTQAELVELGGLAQATGGGLFRVARNPAFEFQRLGQQLSGSYVLELEPDAADRDGHAHAVEVSVARGGMRLQYPRRWTARADPAPMRVESAPPPEPPPPATPVAGSNIGPAPKPLRREPITDPELAVVLTRTADYVKSYIRDFANVVAEEAYEQRIEYRYDGRHEDRKLKSDFLLVTSPGAAGWVPFRDVFEADGRKVRDREDRLKRLFIERPDTAISDARVISEESARYNLGTIQRTTNVPTLPLMLLTPERMPGVNFKKVGEETVQEVTAWRVDFQEWASPTLIRSIRTTDVPSNGTIWVEPLTGRVVRTILRATPTNVDSESMVVYRKNDTLGLWVPAEMHERYKTRQEETTGTAQYTNFRRFQVRTEEKITVPK
ncbi:MAG TPA: hypothetical protein VGK32_16185 [Vicinamibacterales bacterium]|jgi:VWFA-related protein